MMLTLLFHGTAIAQTDFSSDCATIGQISQIDWSSDGDASLKDAAKSSDVSAINLAIWLGGDPAELVGTRWYKIGERERLNVLLMAAIANDNIGGVQDILAQGANPNADAKLDNFMTPLITAARCSSPAMTLMLIRAGAAVNAHVDYAGDQDSKVQNSSALLWASYRGDLSIVNLLLKEGADPNTQEMILDSNKNDKLRPSITPLLTNPPPSVLESLLSSGARPNVADYLGRTPLMLAATQGSYEKCLLLLKSGADRSAKDADGKTASDLATASGYDKLARWINTWHPGSALPVGQGP